LGEGVQLGKKNSTKAPGGRIMKKGLRNTDLEKTFEGNTSKPLSVPDTTILIYIAICHSKAFIRWSTVPDAVIIPNTAKK
jgi:hypothetical protein